MSDTRLLHYIFRIRAELKRLEARIVAIEENMDPEQIQSFQLNTMDTVDKMSDQVLQFQETVLAVGALVNSYESRVAALEEKLSEPEEAPQTEPEV